MPSNAEKRFYAEAQAFLDELLRDTPTVATFLGDHRYDDRLGDFRQVALDGQRQRLGEWLERFQGYRTGRWPLAARIDLTLMVQLGKNFIRGFDKTRQVYRDPGYAVSECLNGIYYLILRDFAPLPERLKNMLGRLREMPRVLQEGRALILPAEVPPVWAEIALESARQGVGLVGGFVPQLAEAVPELKVEVAAAAQAAAAALTDYANWIGQAVLPLAAGQFAAGKALFDEILREDHMVDYESEELLATGWKLYASTEQQMKALAAEMDPDKSVQQLLEAAKQNHPTAENLLDTYRQEMARARQFVIDHDIATIPAGESIRIEATPAFLRPVIPYAAYQMPGFLEAVQEGVFIVTTVEEGLDAEAAERRLRGHPLADIPVTALHEAYPGHHLQLVVSNTLPSLPRKLGAFLSALFIEGWAFYCEELMEQLGFITQPIQQLARLQAQLWRAARIILDVSLHIEQMTVDEAIAFLVERAGLEPDDAKAEVRRYTQSPTQPQSYLMGKMQILEIVSEYQRRHPRTSLRAMHDAILTSGSLPPRLMRLRLFGETASAPARQRQAKKAAARKAANRKKVPAPKPGAGKAGAKKLPVKTTVAKKPAPKKRAKKPVR